MLTITIVCVGKVKEKYLRDAIDEYSKRLSKYCKLDIIELPDEKVPDKLNSSIEQEIKEKEADKIMQHIPKSSYIMALDLTGKQYTSEEFSEPDKLNSSIEQEIKEKEADKIMQHIPKSSYIMALDLTGKQYTSEEFSEKIEDISMESSNITFIIGGTLGMTEKLLSNCTSKICFSKMTFPHQLIRVFLLEQLFRAFKISRGETYHR